MKKRDIVEAVKEALNECDMEFRGRRIAVEPKESFRKGDGSILSVPADSLRKNIRTYKDMIEENFLLREKLDKQNKVIAEKNELIRTLSNDRRVAQADARDLAQRCDIYSKKIEEIERLRKKESKRIDELDALLQFSNSKNWALCERIGELTGKRLTVVMETHQHHIEVKCGDHTMCFMFPNEAKMYMDGMLAAEKILRGEA